MRQGEPTFVDSGAWIALALVRDPLHEAAREQWTSLRAAGARLHTSVPVILETFTFLDRNADRRVALAWRDSVSAPGLVRILACGTEDLANSWAWLLRPEMRRLSLVDATSFTLMRREKIGLAFAFDRHFAQAGFRLAS